MWRETAWWKDSCDTWDGEIHYYRATEFVSPAGTSVHITFKAYETFSSYSEESAIEIFKDWYKKNVKAPEYDLRDQVRQPPIRHVNTDLR